MTLKVTMNGDLLKNDPALYEEAMTDSIISMIIKYSRIWKLLQSATFSEEEEPAITLRTNEVETRLSNKVHEILHDKDHKSYLIDRFQNDIEMTTRDIL